MKRYWIAIIFAIVCETGMAQNKAKKATEYFEAGMYDKALFIFNELLETYPKDPDYNYYAGRCLLKLNRNHDQCRKHLFIASTFIGPEDALFYYARINHVTYHLEEAERSLKQFDNQLSFLKRMSYNIKETEQHIANAKELTSSYVLLDIGDVKNLKMNDLESVYNQLETGFTLDWPSQKDFIEYGLIPSDEYPLLIAGNKDERKFIIAEKQFNTRKTNIYELKKHEDFKGIVPELTGGGISTRKNEQFAWWDSNNNFLYFSSTGHDGMGGFDIYKSRYNDVLDSWEKPENIGFPLNSPFDDFLLPGKSNSKAYLVTNRHSESGNLKMYDISIDSVDIKNADSLSPDDLQSISMFDFDFSEKPIELKTENNEKENEIETIHIPVKKEVSNVGKKYNQIIDKALELQLKADSLFRLADETRDLLSASQDQLQKSRLTGQTKKLTDEAYEIQAMADEHFKMARKMEENDLTISRNEPDSVEEESDRLTADLIRDRLSGTENEQNDNRNDHSLINEFEIRTYSPYHKNNPIPMDYALPDGLLYRIQLGVFSQAVDMGSFGGMMPITGEVIAGNGYKKFYAGLFSRLTDAEKALQQVKSEGYNDAYIVSWFRGKKVSINRAEEIEKSLY